MDDKEFNNCPKRFYTTLEHTNEEVQYSDKGFDKVDANFGGIESVCGKYGRFFSSKFQLYKHLKKSCTGLVQTLPPVSPATTLPIPIIEL